MNRYTYDVVLIKKYTIYIYIILQAKSDFIHRFCFYFMFEYFFLHIVYFLFLPLKQVMSSYKNIFNKNVDSQQNPA